MRLAFRTGFLLSSVLGLMLAIPSGIHAQSPSDAQIRSDVQKNLGNKRFSDVQVAVDNGVVTLNGQVQRFSDKEDAERKAHHAKNVAAISNRIEVAVPEGISDAALHDKLAKALVYDRVGYGTTVYNNITLGVDHGVVTLGGMVYGPTDKDSAISLVANTAGVRDIVDNLEVAPVSPMDDRIRLAEARAIYGYPSLNRYALDPAKTIRITVVNGHVTLNGVVDSKADRDTAGIRANSVPGVFSVENHLQIAGQQAEQ
jgi:hyperosmotically inducible periplasmic protein